MDPTTPKPKGLQPQYGAQFQDPAVANAYHHRPGYPDDLFPALAELVVGTPRRVLDVGCGTGFVARYLIDYVDEIDAVDISAAMIEIGRTLPGGENPNLRWLYGAAEELALNPPYGLVTAGASLHWMEWSVVMPRFRQLLDSGGVVALVGAGAVGAVPWWDELLPVIQRYSTNREFQPYDTVEELTRRGLFAVRGRYEGEARMIRQSVESYIESFHARNGFSRDRMAPEAATAFDEAATAIVSSFAEDGILSWEQRGSITWGEPAPA